MKLLKRLLVINLVLFLLAGVWIVSRLPSGREIVRTLNHAEVQQAPENAAKPTVDSTSDLTDVRRTSASKSTEEPASNNKKEHLRKIISLIDEDPKDIRVCDHLGETKLDTSAKNPNITFDDFFASERTDSILEAYRIPIRAVFQHPSLAELFREGNGYERELEGKTERFRESFLSKVGFYSRVARAGVALYSNKETYERLGDHATHLSIIAKMAHIRPALRENARIMDFCRTIQENHAPLTVEKIRDDRRELLGLIEEAGLKPSELEFDPEDWTRFSMKAENRQLSFSLHGKEPKTEGTGK